MTIPFDQDAGDPRRDEHGAGGLGPQGGGGPHPQGGGAHGAGHDPQSHGDANAPLGDEPVDPGLPPTLGDLSGIDWETFAAQAGDGPVEASAAVRNDKGKLEAELAERTDDLKRLQAEYVNYRKRVERDKAVAGEAGVRAVIDSLTPVLDDIQAAREFGHLEGPFAQIAAKLEESLTRFGWERYGTIGDHFDPSLHEALTVHEPLAEYADTVAAAQAQAQGPVVTMLMQPGYRVGDFVLRPARVAVSES